MFVYCHTTKNIMKKQMSNFIKDILPTYLLYVVLIANFALYLHIRILNYGDTKYVLRSKIFETVIIVAFTFLLIWAAEVLFCESFVNTECLTVCSAILSGTVMLDMVNGECIVGFLTGNRLSWEVMMLFVFPVFLAQLVKISKEDDSTVNKGMGAALVFLWTCILFSISKDLPIAYLVSVVVTNSILVNIVIQHFNNKKTNVKRSLRWGIVYTAFCIGYLFSQKEPYETVRRFLYDQPGWAEYKNSVHLLFQNAKFFGKAFREEIPEGITTLLNSSNPVHTIISNYGFIALILYIFTLTYLVLFFAKVLKNMNTDSSMYYIYVYAFINLVTRVIFGILHSFGGYIQIDLPFVGMIGRKIDWICIAILLVAFDTYQEQMGKKTLFSRIENKILNMLVEHLELEQENLAEEKDEIYNE